MSAESKTEPVKRPRGRPKKTPNCPPEVQKGIINTIDSPNTIVQFINQRADIFKLLVESLQTMKCKYVLFMFSEKYLKICSLNEERKYHTFASYKCKEVLSYFVSKPIEITMSVENLMSVVKKIDKETNKFCIEIDRHTQKQHISITLHYSAQDTIDINKINVVDPVIDYTKFPGFTPDDYPLKFQVNYAFFRKILTNAKAMSPKMEIAYESSTKELRYVTTNSNSQVMSKILPKKEKVKLETDVEGYFSINLSTSNVLLIFKKKLAETVNLYCSEEHAIVFEYQPLAVATETGINSPLDIRISTALAKDDTNILDCDDDEEDDAEEEEDEDDEKTPVVEPEKRPRGRPKKNQ